MSIVFNILNKKIEKNTMVAPIKNIVTVEDIQDRIIKNRELCAFLFFFFAHELI